MSEPAASILVADDDRTIRHNLVKLLNAEGYRPIEASDGEEALARIADESPDAVLLDLKMPGRGGLEVLGELGPALADLPVIVVTAFGGSAAAIEACVGGPTTTSPSPSTSTRSSSPSSGHCGSGRWPSKSRH